MSKIENLSFENKSSIEYQRKIRINILICMIKAPLEDTLKMMVELGIDNIFLYNAHHSVKMLSQDKIEGKMARYQKIIKSAIEQSNTQVIPNISYIKNLDDVCKSDKHNKQVDKQVIVLHHELHKNQISLFDLVNDVDDSDNTNNELLFLIGPEGGFCDFEIDYFEKNNFKFAHILPSIMRSQTVPIAVLSIVNSALYMKYLKNSQI